MYHQRTALNQFIGWISTCAMWTSSMVQNPEAMEWVVFGADILYKIRHILRRVSKERIK